MYLIEYIGKVLDFPNQTLSECSIDIQTGSKRYCINVDCWKLY